MFPARAEHKHITNKLILPPLDKRPSIRAPLLLVEANSEKAKLRDFVLVEVRFTVVVIDGRNMQLKCCIGKAGEVVEVV
jgi:hypothetical protein